jgi:hypothetical protein
MTETNPRAVAGGNLSPFQIAEEAINDLYDEAKNWLDGAAVEDQATADGIAKLLNLIRKAEKDAEAFRKAEKEPHMAAAKAVDAMFKPLADKCALMASACKKALEPFLKAQEAARVEAARKAREEAEEAARKAAEAYKAANPASIEEREAAEEAIKAADKAEAKAYAIARDTSKAKSDVGRAASLRTSHKAVMVDPLAAARYFWTASPDDMIEFLQTLADKAVRQGKREIPGFTIEQIQEVV